MQRSVKGRHYILLNRVCYDGVDMVMVTSKGHLVDGQNESLNSIALGISGIEPLTCLSLEFMLFSSFEIRNCLIDHNRPEQPGSIRHWIFCLVLWILWY